MVRACHKRSKTGNSSAKGNLGHAGRNSFDLGTALELAAIRKGLSAMAVLPADIYIAVNVSPETVLSGDLSDILRGMPTGWIVLEITEHAQVADYERLVAALHPSARARRASRRR